jgi:polyisoprenoid-binding protein YceI
MTRTRKRHWLRWTLIGVAALLVLLVAGAVAAIKLQPVPAPLALPPAAPAAAQPLDGTWRVAPGSVAGFRIQQTVIGLTSDVVGRTGDVTGTVTVAGGAVSSGDLRINLLTLTTGTGKAKPAPQFATSLDTQRFPVATVALTNPVPLGDGLTRGDQAKVNAAGRLTLHGVGRLVTVPLTLRRAGPNLAALGTFPVAFADYGIAQPKGYGWFGSLADHGTAEFLLILTRA